MGDLTWRTIRIAVLLLIVIGLSTRNVGTWNRGMAAEPADPVPEFHLVTMDGSSVGKASLNGKPALLMFWAPWCRVCQQELPVLGKFYQEDRPSQLQVLSIGFADSQDNIEEFIHAHPDTFVFPTAYDEDNVVAKNFRIRATPTFVLLNGKGQIQLVHQGGGIMLTQNTERF